MTKLWTPGDQTTVPQLLDARAEHHGDKTAVTISGETATFADLAVRSIAFANGLHDLGLQHGESLTMLMDNSVDHALTWFGASRVGAVDIPINTAYQGDFLVRTVQTANSSIIVIDEKYAEQVAATAHQAGLKKVVVRGGQDAMALLADSGLDVYPWDVFTEASTSALKSPTAVSPADPSSVIFTSGTTGASKGATFSHNYIISACDQMTGLYRASETDTYFGSMPLFHLAAKACGVLGAVLTGQHAVLDPKFSVSRTWDRVRETEATVVHLLGSMLVMLANQPEREDDADLPMRAIFAAPVPGRIHKHFETRFNCKIVTCYALSEACQITVGDIDTDYPLDSAGKPNTELFDMRLVDETDVDVPPGEIGEIVVRPKRPLAMFSGYWRNAEATLEQFDNLWFHTGDLGRLDADDWFYYEGRKKDALRRRGENVSAAELEDVLRQHPHVNDAAAVGVPSDVAEEDIFAVVELLDGVELTHVELYDFCVEKLPFFMVPRYYEFVDALPRNPIAKIEKYKLKVRGVTTETWDSTNKEFCQTEPTPAS
jgi:crotonobetaine/carnitine-CoA ligase